MKQLARQHGISRTRFKRLNLLKFDCEEPKAAERLEQAMSMLEHEYEIAKRNAHRMFMVIGKQVLRTHR